MAENTTAQPQIDWYEDFKTNHPEEFAQWLRDKEADELKRCQEWHPEQETNQNNGKNQNPQQA